jgi:peptidoglycan-N-acetylglucosamine deacetylase
MTIKNLFYLSTITILLQACNLFGSNDKQEEGKNTKATNKKTTTTTKNETSKPPQLFTPAYDSSKKTIYLTFDDGPNEGTPNLIEVLKKYHVPVSLFLVGRQAGASERYMDMYKQEQSLDNVVFNNHSWSHANGRYQGFYSNPAGVVEDFRKCKDLFKFDNKIGRGPGRNAWRVGSISATDIKASSRAMDVLKDNGYHMIGWDIEWHMKLIGGYVQPVQSADQMLQEIDAAFANNNMRVKNHLILLAHDQMWVLPQHKATLNAFFERLTTENKYNIQYITKYPECKGLMN